MSTNESRLDGKRVVIVGGTSGMGRGAALAAAKAGAEVVIAGRKKPDSQELSQLRFESVDITDEASAKSLFERVGALDHLLVTAAPKPGSSSSGKFLEQDVAAAREFVDAKLFGSWAAARYAAPRLGPGGSITFVTGGAAVRPKAGITMISAAFAALETLTRGLAIELGPIRVNALRPGYTDSEMWGFLDEASRAALFEKVRATMPTRRLGTVDDIGHAAVFLMTNPQMTGAVLEITGGETLVDGL